MTEIDTSFLPAESQRKFDISIRGNVGMEFYGSSGIDLGGDVVVSTEEIEAVLSDMDGFPSNVDGAVELHEMMSTDDIVIEKICEGITASVRHALKQSRLNG